MRAAERFAPYREFSAAAKRFVLGKKEKWHGIKGAIRPLSYRVVDRQ
jgi:hypothetical protein